MEALTSRRSQGTRVGHTNSFRRRITRLGRSRSSASTQRHLTSATEHERALTRRELALRAVADVGADRHLPEHPNDRGTARGFLLRRARPTVPRALGASWSKPRATSRTRLRHRRGDQPCGRSLIARPHGVRLGVTMRVHRVRIVRAYRPLRSQDGAASLELIQQHSHRCWSTRGYHAWTKGITVRAACSKASGNGRCHPSRPSSPACRWTRRRGNARARSTAGTSGGA